MRIIGHLTEVPLFEYVFYVCACVCKMYSQCSALFLKKSVSNMLQPYLKIEYYF